MAQAAAEVPNTNLAAKAEEATGIMNALSLLILLCVAVSTTLADGLFGACGFELDDEIAYGGHCGVGGAGIGSTVAFLLGGPEAHKAVPGPAILVETVQHINKVDDGGALLAHSGLEGGYGFGHEGLGLSDGFGLDGKR